MWRSAVALLAAVGLAVTIASCDPNAPDSSSTAQESPRASSSEAETPQPTPTPTEAVLTEVSREVLADGKTVIKYSDGTVITQWPTTDHRPTPLPTRRVQVGSEIQIVEYDCGYGGWPVSIARYGGGVLAWSSGGAGILFNYDGAIWLADEVTGEIYYLLESSPDPDGLAFGYYADISSAGDRIAYTSCAFPRHVTAGGNYPAVAHEMRPSSANYDIVVGEIDKDGRDGITSNTRITKTPQRLDHYPVWSPDGIWITSLSMDRTPSKHLSPKFLTAKYLNVRRVDGSMGGNTLVSTLGQSSGGIALIPPVWSPDGQYLAYYLVTETADELYTYALHTTRVDKLPKLSNSGQHKIGSVISRLDAIPPRPSWSPDGQRIAFVANDGIARRLFIAEPDGTDRRQVASDPGIREVAWSPDGSEILIVSDRPNLVFVSPDGARRRQLELSPTLLELSPALSTLSPLFRDGLIPDLVVWSPDGSRIALSIFGLLVTMDRDGTDPRTLNGGVLRRPAVDPAVCSMGVVVPDPKVNPGLVRDCETLLKSVETLAGDSLFRWRPDLPITRWQGVRVTTYGADGSEGLPLRVRELRLESQQLSRRYQRLAGSIPRRFGDLDALEVLVLSGNKLTGPIPPALGTLAALRELDLSYTDLSGTLPPELGNLTNLIRVDVSKTRLTGCIPRESRAAWAVRGSRLYWRCAAASGQ